MAQPQLLDNSKFVDLTKNQIRAKPISRSAIEKTLEKRYTRLSSKRSSFLERARRFSAYTLPNMYPHYIGGEMGGDGVDTTGWQSFGAQCVNNITNKLVMTLFPPHSSFARLELTPKAASILTEEDINIIDQNKSLMNAEREALLEHERIAGRVGLGEAIEHLIVGGTTCLYMPDEGNLINYPLDRFVCRRDKSGNLLELIIEEDKAIDTFEPAIQAVIKARLAEKKPNRKDEEDNIKLFTQMLRKGKFYEIKQEVMGEAVGKVHYVLPENSPFIVLRWKTNYGEDYGRSLVEQYANDFHFIQFLSEAMAKGMILMSDVKYLVKRGATIDVDHLISSPTGEFVHGDIDDIGVLQLERFANFEPIANVLDKYERRVGNAFMLGAAIQRNAERVTAYEIRRDAIEMEQQLGGAYSLLANTLQRPYFRLLLNRIDFDLPSNLVNTVLLTGIEALSKMTDADKFMQWSEQMATAAQLPPQVQERLKWGDFSQHVANQLSYDMPFVMTEDEYREYSQQVAEQQQMQMMQEGLANSIPQAINNMTRQ